MPVIIRTNNQKRPILSFYELSADQQKEHDWCIEGDTPFVVYRGAAVPLENFTVTGGPGFSAWDGIACDSFSAGLCIRLTAGGEFAVIGNFYVTGDL